MHDGKEVSRDFGRHQGKSRIYIYIYIYLGDLGEEGIDNSSSQSRVPGKSISQRHQGDDAFS